MPGYILFILLSVAGDARGVLTKDPYVIPVNAFYDSAFMGLRADLGEDNAYEDFVRSRMQEANRLLNKLDLHILLTEPIREASNQQQEKVTRFDVILSGDVKYVIPSVNKSSACDSKSTVIVNVKDRSAEKAKFLSNQKIVHDIVYGLIACFGVIREMNQTVCTCNGNCVWDMDSDSLTMPTCDKTALVRSSRMWTCVENYVIGKWQSRDEAPICGNGIIENSQKTKWDETCDCYSFDQACRHNCTCPGGWGEEQGSIGPGTVALIVVCVILLISVIVAAVFFGLRKKGPPKSPSLKTEDSSGSSTTQSKGSTATTKA